MVEKHRKIYNDRFNPDAYQAFMRQFELDFPGQLDFRVAETPLFVPKALKDQILQAGEEIIDALLQPEFKNQTRRAIPPGCEVPNEDEHPSFLVLDYAVCKDAHGNLTPQLIELQGFTTLFGYQPYMASLYPKFFYVPEGFSAYFNGLDHSSYLQELRRFFIGDLPEEQVILLEIFPEKQKTRIDFAATKKYFGIEPVCLTKVRRSGRSLYYEKDGRKIDIRRIFNRVIFDELDTLPDLKTEFKLTDDVDVEWLAHPNWFFRVSKFSLPLLQSPYVPESFFLHHLDPYPDDLENYVLKPLFSFAGQGVRLNITKADLDAIVNKENFLLQRKVTYEPVLQSPSGGVKVELRMMYIWPKGQERPKLVINLGRLSKGEMIGVRYNVDFDWVGSSIGYFEI
ncbi:MAG: hypothetical protein IPN74_04910 [Haliscomenobacter sp.]|nr:hypothetical protein [Haliscomenobacter sp.]MBK8877893.1 hypothetical protein [Haliscomenobacter sp.]